MEKSILLIDDCSINLFIAGMIIKDHGFFETISTYTSAQEALNFLIASNRSRKNLPEVILLDINMPGMNGWQFLDQYEEKLPSLIDQIDIFILSSSLDDRDFQRSKTYLSIKQFLTKPLEVHTIENIIIGTRHAARAKDIMASLK